MDLIKSGSIWILRTAPILDVTNARLTGLTDIKFTVSRYTSGAWQWLDFADMTFKASPGTLQATMTEVSSTKAAGVYGYALDTSTITNATLGDYLFIDIQQTTLTTAINANQAGGGLYGYVVDKVEANLTVATSSLATSSALATVQADTDDIQTRLPAALVSGRMDCSVGAMASNVLTASAIASNALTSSKIATDAIGAAQIASDAVTEIQTGLATSTALATAQSDITTLVNYGAPPSAATISAQVNTDLTTAHGAGSYQTASTAGLATATDVTDAVTAIETHGDAAWATATGFAEPGDSMTLTAGERTTLVTDVRQAMNLDHGAGLYLTATGFAEPGDPMSLVDDAITAAKIAPAAIGVSEAPLLAHLDADVSSRLATVAYTSPPTAAANAAAVWATVESTGVDGTMGGSLWKTRRRLTQRASTSVLGVVTLYLDDNVTPETTFTLTDVDGNPVTIVAGDPARRSAET